LSVPDAIGVALYEWYQDKQGVQQELMRTSGEFPAVEQVPEMADVVRPASTPRTAEQMEMEGFSDDARSFIGTCPDCGSQLEFAEGCVKCHVCGFSECG
jgi:ribonucleoside-diphosphate reductase alpha chain